MNSSTGYTTAFWLGCETVSRAWVVARRKEEITHEENNHEEESLQDDYVLS